MSTLKGLAILLSIFSMTGCVLFKPAIKGSGTIIAQPIDVVDFQEIDFSGGGSMIVEVGSSTPSCIIEVDDNLLEHIVVNVDNGKLKIYSKEPIAPSKGLIVRITTPSLRYLSTSGSCDSKVTGLSGPEFDVNVSGSGSVQCTGTVDNLSFAVSGSGSLEADQLECKNAKISVSGSGDAVVNATEKLNASISGSGQVRYLGSPQVTQNISGSGSIEQMK